MYKMKFNTLFGLLNVCLVLNYTIGQTTQSSKKGDQINEFKLKKYVYIQETNALYMFHQTPKNYNDAKTTCENEGASLFYPDTAHEATTVMAFFQNKYKESLPKELLLGLERTINGFETVDGIPITKVHINWRSGEPNNNSNKENCVMLIKPELVMADVLCSRTSGFICKSRINNWNEECQISNEDYGYSEELGKCYKFHLTPKTWAQAQEKCRAEQSQLAVINSQEEAAYLVRLTRKVLRNVPGRFSRGVVLLGFHNNNVEDWQTIEGTSLYYSGYACWGNSQPDGGERDRCGSMFYNGHLNDIGCDQKAFFICEHDNAALNYVYEPRSFYNIIQAVQCHDTI